MRRLPQRPVDPQARPEPAPERLARPARLPGPHATRAGPRPCPPPPPRAAPGAATGGGPVDEAGGECNNEAVVPARAAPRQREGGGQPTGRREARTAERRAGAPQAGFSRGVSREQRILPRLPPLGQLHDLL